MEKKLPVFYAKVKSETTPDPEKPLGIQAIALVDDPAMLTQWLMFSNQKPVEFKMSVNKVKGIVTAPLLIADLPIYRDMKDPSGVQRQFYVVYTKDVITEIAMKFARENRNNLIKLNHGTSQISKGVFVFEMFQSDSERGISPPAGFDHPDGTLYVSLKIENPDILNKALKGEINGISLEGYFDLEIDTMLTEQEAEAIINEITS